MLNEQKLSSSRKNNKGVSEMKFLKGIAFGIMVLMAVFSVSSIETLGNFKVNECINLKQICSNCSYVNITSILMPNSTQILGEVKMTKLGTEYNYTFCDASMIGDYIVNGKGDLDGKDTIFAYDFKITTTGNEGNIIPIFLFIGGILFFVIAIISKNPIIGIFSGMILILAGIFMMIYGFGNISNDYSRGIAFISLGFGFVVSFVSVVELAED